MKKQITKKQLIEDLDNMEYEVSTSEARLWGWKGLKQYTDEELIQEALEAELYGEEVREIELTK